MHNHIEASNDNKEKTSSTEIRQIIREIKRKAEEEFQERISRMSPEEQEKAIEEANDLF